MPNQIERSICCDEDATFNDDLENFVCSHCKKECEIVDWSEPDLLTYSQLQEVKAEELEQALHNHDWEQSRGI